MYILENSLFRFQNARRIVQYDRGHRADAGGYARGERERRRSGGARGAELHRGEPELGLGESQQRVHQAGQAVQAPVHRRTLPRVQKMTARMMQMAILQ